MHENNINMAVEENSMIDYSKHTITQLKKERENYPVESKTYNNITNAISRKRAKRKTFNKNTLRKIFG